VRCSEWTTSQGYHCIERCMISSRLIGEYGIDNVLTCPVVDGTNLEYKPRPSSGREMQEYDKYFWDYCTPSLKEALGGDGDESELGTMKPVPIPENGINFDEGNYDGGESNSGNSGYNPGNRDGGSNSGYNSGYNGGNSGSYNGAGGQTNSASGYNPGRGNKLQSSLYGVPCLGSCKTNQISNVHKCTIPANQLDTSANQQNNFWCSPETQIPRDRLTSRTKLWCIGPCQLTSYDGNYECKTLFGYDWCSPQSGVTVKSEKCHGTCTEDSQDEKGHYKCYVDDMRTNKDHCSPMSSDLPNLETKAIEYSNEGKVCAGPCQKRDGSPMCDVVFWEWNEEKQESNLQMGLEYCGPVIHTWRTVGIIIGCVLAAIAIIAIVAVVVARKKYNRVNTGGE